MSLTVWFPPYCSFASPVFPNEGRLTEAAVSSFTDCEKPYLVRGKKITFVIAGRHKLNILLAPFPYKIEDPPSPGIWSQHRAWIAVDHLDRDFPDQLAGCARLAAELVDDNCIAVYIPRRGKFLPNDSTLQANLRTLS